MSSCLAVCAIHVLLQHFDTDHSGFITWLKPDTTARVDALLLVCLQHFDTDDSGFITREELEVALREHAADAAQLEGDIDAVLAQVGHVTTARPASL
jgi:hypothetical protein